MNSQSRLSMKQLALKIIRWLVIIELAYLALVNIALQVPLTQSLVNMIRPEKFQVSWDKAWSWYPFRVHAEGIFANGQSRSQQWQVEAASASGSISLLPLVLKRVQVRNVSAVDIEYRQRPRLKPDRDYTALLPHFPEIRDREVASADSSPRKKKRPWKVSLRDMRASGAHSYWIYNLKGSGRGVLVADMDIEAPGGPAWDRLGYEGDPLAG